VDAIATKPKPQDATDTVVVSRPLFEAILSLITYRCGGHKYDVDDERAIALALVKELRAQLKESDQ
jgi:hypothetical protein